MLIGHGGMEHTCPKWALLRIHVGFGPVSPALQPYKGRTVSPLLDYCIRLAGEYRLLPLSSGAVRSGGPPSEVQPG